MIEQMVLEEYSQDDAYAKKQKKHFFSIRHRRRHQRYMREVYRRAADGESVSLSRKLKRIYRTSSKFAKVAVAACLAVVALTAAHVTATNVHLDKIGNSLLQGFDDHVQFSEKATRPKILKWLDEKLAAGADNAQQDAVTETETAFEKKMPQYLPEGYELVSEEDHITYGYFKQKYSDHDGHTLYYSQYTDMNNTGLSSDGKPPRSVQINGQDGFLTSDEVTRTVVWTDSTYYYCLNGNVSEETLLDIAVNVN
ncbi:MAG: DUF4367 domain-containing protein [Lachnospiraceae bacterium]|nr:DUF4367 domain-containing protein [Lachnospiraceae bacterium]